jgi:hypothetical protein
MKKYKNHSKKDKKATINDHTREWDWVMKFRKESEPKIKYTKDNISKDFPQKELGDKLNGVFYYIEDTKLKDFVYDILKEKGLLEPKQIVQVYRNPLWMNAIREFMQTREDFKKDGNRYVKIQK